MSWVEPRLPASDFKTYQIAAPLRTHWRPSNCVELDCPNYLHGWRMDIDESSELGQAQAHYVRKQSGRKFTEERLPEGLTRFTFEAGQKCFEPKHVIRIDKPELFIVKGGDWRGNPRMTRPRVHQRPADWVDDFANHQDKLKTVIERG